MMKIRIQVIVTREVEVQKEWYPEEVKTDEDILKFEQESVEQDPVMFMDNEDADWEFSVTKVE